MLRIAALNESGSSEGSHSQAFVREATKEAKEAEAYTVYNEALALLRNGKSTEAEAVFRDLIDHDFLVEAWEILEERGSEAIHPGLQLLYSIQKNLATMSTERKDYTAALESYMEAVKIDSTEVTVWYKLGLTALAVEDYQLAMVSFEQGLEVNPKHWPCLDKIIPLLYAFNNYIECLYYVARAFEMEMYYMKGYAFRNTILKEVPMYKEYAAEFFDNCDPGIHTVQIDPEKAKMYVDDALKIRRRNQELCKPKEPVRLKFPSKIKQYSWKHVGEMLIGLYDEATTADPPKSIVLKVDVPDYSKVPESDETTDKTTDENVDKDKADGDDKEMDTGETSIDVETNDPDPSYLSEMDIDKDDKAEAIYKVGELETDKIEMERADDDTDKEANLEKKAYSENPSKDQSDDVEMMEVEGNEKPEDPDDMKVESEVKSDESVTEVKVFDKKDRSTDLVLADIKDKSLEADNKVVDSQTVLAKSSSYGFNVTNSTDEVVSLKEKADSVDIEADDSDMPVIDASKKDKVESEMESREDNDIKQTEDIKAELTTATTTTTAAPSTPPTETDKESSKSEVTSGSGTFDSPIEVDSPVVTSISSSKPTYSFSSALPDFTVIPVSTPVVSISVSEFLTTTSATPVIPTTSDSVSSSSELASVKSVTANSESGLPLESKSETVSTSLAGSNSDKMEVVSEPIPASSSSVLTTVSGSVTTSSASVVVSSESVNQDIVTTTNSTVLSSGIAMSSTISTILISTSSVLPSSTSLTYSVSSATSSTALSSSSAAAALPTSAPSVSSLASATSVSSVATTPSSSVTSSPSVVMSTTAAKSPVTTPGQKSPRKDHEYSKAYGDMPMSAIVQGSSRCQGSVILQESESGGTLVEISMDLDEKKKGQKRKRISCTTEEIMMYGKRRSARVRATGRKKEEETVNFADLLQAFLPSSIKNFGEDDDTSMDTDAKSMTDPTPDKSDGDKSTSAVTMVTEEWEEEKMVKYFLQQCVKNAGLICIMNKYLYTLAKHSHVKWPAKLCEVYISVYDRVRKHVYIPNVYDDNDTPEIYQEVLQICLVWLELYLDKWLSHRRQHPGIISPRSPGLQILYEDELPAFYEDDMWFVEVVCQYRYRIEPLYPHCCIRVYWARARFEVLKGKMEDAVFNYEQTKEYLKHMQEELGTETISLPNCCHDNLINLSIVTSEQEALQKSQSVEEAQRCYDLGQYENVVTIMLQSFNTEKQQGRSVVREPGERQAHMLLLLESLCNTKDYKKCLLWSEEFFHECYTSYQNCFKPDRRTECVKTMKTIFQLMYKSLEHGTIVSESMSQTKIVRLSQNLIRLIDTNMSLPDTVTEMTFDTVIPWIVLYYIIQQEEDELQRQMLTGEARTDLSDNLSSSHMLLNIAHDYLGSRSWCTKSDGALLLFMMTVLESKLRGERDGRKFQEDYKQAYEQCVYCLYGHPNRKGKAKHLQDHNCKEIVLTWKEAVMVFKYFRPRLPEFDGYRSETISAELEHLLSKKILPLVPETSKEMGVKLECIQSYIEGSTNDVPAVEKDRKVTLPVVREIYYLLADYHLKNKESLKAIKLYTQDLCYKPDRLDSWAGMALARMSRLDAKLAAADLMMDMPLTKCTAALRCFQRAVDIDDSNNKLWIEYGTLAYQLHAHASRQLKWAAKNWFKKMDEKFIAQVRKNKQEMLQTATHCFNMAATCDPDFNEDKWLHNYMLGKCGEKSRKPLREFIPYYLKGLACAHEEGAKYPKRIMFAYTTPHLAVEALEMYYRIHVSILKMLLKYPATSEKHDYKLYVRYLLETSTVPFVLRIEKGQEGKSERESASSADESSQSGTPFKPTSSTPRRTDHTYFRQKSNILSPLVTSQMSNEPGKSVDSIDKVVGNEMKAAEQVNEKSNVETTAKGADDTAIKGSDTKGSDTSAKISGNSTIVPDTSLKTFGTSLQVPDALVAPSDDLNKGKSVSTLELHSEQSSSQHAALTITECAAFEEGSVSKVDIEGQLGQEKGLSSSETGQELRKEGSEAAMEVDCDLKVKADSDAGNKDKNEEKDAISFENVISKVTDASDQTNVTKDAKNDANEARKAAEGIAEGNAEVKVEETAETKSGQKDDRNVFEDVQNVLASLKDKIDEEGDKEHGKNEPMDTENADKGETNETKEQTERESETKANADKGAKDTTEPMETDHSDKGKPNESSVEIKEELEDKNEGISENRAEMVKDTKDEPVDGNSKDKTDETDKEMDDKSDDNSEVQEHNGDSQGSSTNPAVDEDGDGQMEDAEFDIEKDPRFLDQINNMLKLSEEALHKDLMEKCRKAVMLCLQRFSTHYKSHYRLAYIYVNSPYHKDLQKAHNVMLGAQKWQQLDYMPCQGLFGERKQTKFFQGIWKIPIDEIDRSGSFPSHLNRCIELVLDILRERRDSHTLHQVHLQLNRQPEPGKKYLRDTEKRYYALLSHQYTLDIAELQISDMKSEKDSDTRLQFLQTVYKIWEHGVHKLAKEQERTNRLLAEAYRVVVRKLETLPHKMLLDEAKRFCKQMMQKPKPDKPTDMSSQSGSSMGALKSAMAQNTTDTPTSTLPGGKLSLDNLMKNQPMNSSLMKSSLLLFPNLPVSSASWTDQSKDGKLTMSDVIVLSDSESKSQSQDSKSQVPRSANQTPTSAIEINSSPAVSGKTEQTGTTGTVKIKMGLLQAAKRLKPVAKDPNQSTSTDMETSMDESSALSGDESEAVLPSATEAENSIESSSSSSSSSSSESDGDSSSDEENDEKDSDSSNDDDDSDSDDDDKTDERVSESKPTPKLKMKPREPTEDEDSSDNDNEIDLVSSADERDDDKDKDYNASEDEDVIMISDDEFKPRGRAVIPSPVRKEEGAVEILVKDVPDFDPLISSIMSDAIKK